MGLVVYLTAMRKTEVFTGEIDPMFEGRLREAGLYDALSKPNELGIRHASQLVGLLSDGIRKIESNRPDEDRGNWDYLVRWLRTYLAACQAHSDAVIGVID